MARVSTIADQRKSLGFDVFTGEDKKAAERLAELNTEAANLHGELESIEGALAEGQRRLSEARAAEAAKRERYQAQMLAKELETFAQCGADLDQALKTLIVAGNKMQESLGRMHALGQTVPNKMQFDALSKNALFHALLNSPWKKYFPNVLLSPDRQSFGQLTAKWVSGIKSQITKRLAA